MARKRYKRRKRTRLVGKLTNYISRFNKSKHQPLLFFPLPRESSKGQVKKGHLDNQNYRLQKHIEENSLDRLNVVFDVFDESGKLLYTEPFVGIVSPNYWKDKEDAAIMFQNNPHRYINPEDYAKPHYRELEIIIMIIKSAVKRDVGLLVESVDRIIRSDDFHFSVNRDAPVSKQELEGLKHITEPYPIISICPVKAGWKEVDSWRKSYGEKNKRPRESKPKKTKGWTKRRRMKYHPKVIEARLAGESHGSISKRLKLPIELVRTWWWRYVQK